MSMNYGVISYNVVLALDRERGAIRTHPYGHA